MMADMYMIFGSLILIGISYPALLTTWWLLFPEGVERARLRISEKPKKSFGMGLLAGVIAAIPTTIFFTLPSQFTQVLGWIWLVLVLGAASLGAAGIAAEIGLRLNWKSDGELGSLGAFLRGALIWELASAFPVIGWLLIIPVGTLISLGGAVYAIFKKKSSQEAD
ncbi:MAG: hypothetical protein MUO54_15520 [Anaerolineales bacterium]|nr:hypothetical protein [Anaerolineales bacterium]